MDRMKLIGKFCIVLLTLTFCLRADAQSRESDVLIPIGKYIMQGGDVSKSQARQIVKSFFEAQTPQGFKITHTSGRNNMKYALGALNAGGETYSVTIFVTSKGGTYKIREFRIERQ